MESNSYISHAQQVVQTEVEALLRLQSNLNQGLDDALTLIINCRGRVVVSGMGKSGLVGKKISATLSSTGTPSFFLHPAEALHGDLGMMKSGDLLLSISNSGSSDEILRLIPFIKSNGIKHICMTGKLDSILAKNADVTLDISIDKEACPLQLAPMASTTASLVMGDVLAACLMEMRGFKPENFAQFHPAGALGRKLLSTVADEMRTDNLPIANADLGIKQLIYLISKGHLGLAIICDQNQKVQGLVTDGDIRRALEKYDENQFFKLKAQDIMTLNPILVPSDAKISEVEELLKQKKIKALLVADNQIIKGVFEYNGVL
jgi:arabinose-5-phosphate isomerase